VPSGHLSHGVRAVGFGACSILAVFGLAVGALGGGVPFLALAAVAFAGSWVAVAKWSGYLATFSDRSATAVMISDAVVAAAGYVLLLTS
jgi:hypothetical protein